MENTNNDNKKQADKRKLTGDGDDWKPSCSSTMAKDANGTLKKSKMDGEKSDGEVEKEVNKTLDDCARDVVCGDLDPDFLRDVEELRSYKNVDYRSYRPGAHVMIERPTDKVMSYRKMTRVFGFEFNSKNEFLRRGGILNVLELERPFFAFWEHGLEFFSHIHDIAQTNEKYQKFLVKRTSCVKHEFRCPHPHDAKPDDMCVIVSDVLPSTSAIIFISGTLRVRVNAAQKFKSFNIQLDNSQRIDSANGVKIADQVSISAETTVHIINSCNHENCEIGEDPDAFPGMKAYRMCKNIVKNQKLNDVKIDVDMKRCYMYGKGLSGKLYKPTNTTYLTTYEVKEMYIVNY